MFWYGEPVYILNRYLDYFFSVGTLTPLMVISQAAKKGEENIVKCAELLIKSGSNVNSHDKYAKRYMEFIG